MEAERRRVLLGAVAALTVVLGGCTEIENTLARVEMLNFMHDAPFLDPYEAPRNAPPMSVPLESPGQRWEPPVERTETALRAWGDTLTNPYGMTEEVLTAGARTYQTYCAVCHGVTAEGNGPVVGQGKMPFATNLLLPTTEQRSDGYIYAVVRVGRGLMPSYRRIPPSERWAVVNYVRYLQGGADPIPVELPGLVQPGRDQLNATAPDAGADTDPAGQE